ncbi:MAG: sigma 54-interacting transcriptional regulator [Planctomycetota bacterium]|nr:sigma 54-interacting transcriptional regulator [Planctomycetota bacterium]
MPTLRVVRGRSTAEQFSFKDVIHIGRAPENEVRVFDEAVSRRHALVRREEQSYVAEDCGSTNGLFVNGRRVQRAVLKTGDEVSVRGLTLVVLEDGAVQRSTVAVDRRLEVQSRLEPKDVRFGGPEESVLPRLAALYRVTELLGTDRERLKTGLLQTVEEAFGPCRAALVLPTGSVGVFSRSVVDLVGVRREALIVRDPPTETPGAESLIATRVSTAMAAPLGNFGVLYVDRSGGEAFGTEDLELLTALANAVTPALRPADLAPPPTQGAARMLGDSPAMLKLAAVIERVAPTSATVLITGETGTGKELVARSIHSNSPRTSQPFVAVNCAAFVETLLEAELFGHEKGAYTGADRARAGRFEQAHGGTLFLDEVGELSPGIQAKLLRVLEEREFHRLGATKTTRVDVRILAATNRDLRAGGFREDLYYRLGVVTLECPPLRERPGDVALLVRAFLNEHRFSDDAMRLIEAYDWPGNVRELRNLCERCSVLAQGEVIESMDLPLEVRIGHPAGGEPGSVRTLKEMEREMVVRALEATGGNRTKAAKLLGITYPTIKKKIDEFGL